MTWFFLGVFCLSMFYTLLCAARSASAPSQPDGTISGVPSRDRALPSRTTGAVNLNRKRHSLGKWLVIQKALT